MVDQSQNRTEMNIDKMLSLLNRTLEHCLLNRTLVHIRNRPTKGNYSPTKRTQAIWIASSIMYLCYYVLLFDYKIISKYLLILPTSCTYLTPNVRVVSAPIGTHRRINDRKQAPI